jgi:hypothetical protein
MSLKNIASLTVCLTALGLSAFQQYENVGTLVATYVVADFFFTEDPDIQIHHILIASFIASVSNLNPGDYSIEARGIVNLEISTLFLALNHLMKDKIIVAPALIYKVNQFLFLATFAKYRIWDYYWIFLARKSFPSSVTMITIYGIFLLDLYWFFVILKKLYKVTFHISAPKYNIRKTEESNPCFSGTNAS